MNMSQFIESCGLSMSAVSIPSRTDTHNETPEDEKWREGASHWRVTLTNQAGKAYSVEYSMGSAHRVWKKGAGLHVRTYSGYIDCERREVKDGERLTQKYMNPKTIHLAEMVRELSEPVPPTTEDVLESLRLDVMGADNADTFEDWAAECGYSTDSRRAESVYVACCDAAKRLRGLLGRANYETLMSVEV